ncbi:hypothetical protein K438DRAFT_1617181, partial [Mycena galopus ATCC 62051]
IPLTAVDQAGEPSINASNRYFTSKKEDPEAEAIPFKDGVDPIGALRRVTNDDLVHTADNIVGYYKKVTDSAGEVFYESASPASFRVGDIVSIEAAVVAFKNGQHKLRMHTNLRALTLLDSTLSKASRLSEGAVDYC